MRIDYTLLARICSLMACSVTFCALRVFDYALGDAAFLSLLAYAVCIPAFSRYFLTQIERRLSAVAIA